MQRLFSKYALFTLWEKHKIAKIQTDVTDKLGCDSFPIYYNFTVLSYLHFQTEIENCNNGRHVKISIEQHVDLH